MDALLRIQMFNVHFEHSDHFTVIRVIGPPKPRGFDLSVSVDSEGQESPRGLAVRFATLLGDPFDLARQPRIDAEVQRLRVDLLFCHTVKMAWVKGFVNI